MSRSRRHTPICGMTTARSEKGDKRQAHRRLRARTRTVAARDHPGTDSVWPIPREVSDPWDMAKDGKLAFDPRRHHRLMRK